MFTHDKVWCGIDRLAETNGYSASGLAKKAGLDSTSFNKSKRHSPDGKPRWPSTESIAKILNVTETEMRDFVELVEANETPSNDRAVTNERKKEIAHEAAKILLDTRAVSFNTKEPFTLTSGKKSPTYVDCRKLIGFVNERQILMDAAVEILKSEISGGDTLDYIAGGETAGIPYAAFVAERMNKPMLYVRKKPKGFGRMAQIEGYMPKDAPRKNVILVEDLQTDGGSKKIFIDVLRDAGAIVKHAFVVFHYGIYAQSEANMAELGITLHSLCNWWDVLSVAREGEYFDPVTLNSVEDFLNNPETWAT